jgi:hypothetical protein
MKKSLKILALSLALAVSMSVVAYATNYNWDFVFTNTATTSNTPTVSKGDSEQNWYISIDSTNPSGRVNTLSSTNKLGVRANFGGGGFASIYVILNSYVSGYSTPYTSTVTAQSQIFMGAKKDDSSTSSASLYVSGRWNP